MGLDHKWLVQKKNYKHTSESFFYAPITCILDVFQTKNLQSTLLY